MRRPTRSEVVLAVVFVLVVAVLLLWFRGGGPVGHSTDPTGHASVRASSSFTISGTDTLTTHVLPVGAGVGTWSGLSVSLTNNLTVNQDLCKTASITITYTVAAGV